MCFLSQNSTKLLDCDVCDVNMCCNIPSNHQYFLTDFCDGPGTMACGESCGYTTYYTADRQRFGCGAHLNICGYGKCAKAEVADAGPANWVSGGEGGERRGRVVVVPGVFVQNLQNTNKQVCLNSECSMGL